jgi:hypothetical protein
MKKLLFAAAFLFTNFMTNAQLELGVKAGVNSIDLISDGIVIKNGLDNFKVDFLGSAYGYHLGLYSRVKILGLYIEPAAYLNSNKVNYKLTDYTEGDILNDIVSENYTSLDIPVHAGIKAGVFRLYGGPVGHLHIASTSDLIKINGYKQKFKDAKYGFQAGFGLDLWKLRLDVAYEGNLGKFADHINIGGNQFQFDSSASRVLGTVGFRF